MYGFDSEHAASESWAMVSFFCKASDTQVVSDSLPLGIVVHSWLSLIILPEMQEAKFHSVAQKRPSLLADVQKPFGD